VTRVALVLVFLLFASSASAQAQSVESLDAWRADYEARLTADYGWLSVAGLSFLREGVNTVGSLRGSVVQLPAGEAPLEVGRIVYHDGRATLHLRTGTTALVDGAPAPRVIPLDPQDGGAAPRVRVGDVEFHLHRSGARTGIRIRDPHSAIRTGFAGLQWFAADPAYDVVGTLQPHPTPRRVLVRNVLGDQEPYTSPGTLSFSIDGRTLTLVPFAARDGRLWLVFRDATAGHETYGTRFLYAEPVGGNRYRVDFNRAYNPPCAYNPHTTCPTPLDDNVLPAAIRAGERIYRAPVTARR
jgi:uncharacterized protein